MMVTDRSQRALLRGAVAVVFVAACVAGVVWQFESRVTLPSGISADDYALARAVVAKSQVRDPESAVWLQLGEWAFQRKDFAAARASYRQIPSDRGEAGCRARALEGETSFRLGLATEAEANFREAISFAEAGKFQTLPEWSGSHSWLRNVLEIELRFEERHELLTIRHQAGVPEVLDTVVWCFPSLLRWNGAEAVAGLEKFHAGNPQDFRVRVALARYRTGAGQLEEALAVVTSCLAERPDDLPANAAMLELHSATGEWDAMRTVIERLPSVARTDPWLLLLMRGHLLQHDEQWAKAEACFRILLEIDASQVEARTGLARALRGQGRTSEAQQIDAQAAVLARIQNRLGWILERPGVEPLVETAEMCHEIQLARQCSWMARQALQIEPQNKRALELLQQTSSRP